MGSNPTLSAKSNLIRTGLGWTFLMQSKPEKANRWTFGDLDPIYYLDFNEYNQDVIVKWDSIWF